MYDFQTVKLLHRHGGDEWAPMLEGSEHGPVAHDPERSWLRGARIFRCSRCDDEIMIKDPASETPVDDQAEGV